MNKSKWSCCRCAQILLWLVLCGGGMSVLGGEMKSLSDLTTSPLVTPFVPPNSTFRSDSRMLHPAQRRIWRQDIAPQKQLAQLLNARWMKAHQLPVSLSADEAVASGAPADTAAPQAPVVPPPQTGDSEDVQWKPLIAQAMTFLWIEHSFRLLTEPGTREELRGPFFKDWFTSVRRTRGWADGDPFIVNYIGHSMQGSVTNYIYVHNDPKSRKLEMGMNKAYFKSRLKAMLFSTVYSTQFELGPLSEASLGNVGRIPSEKSRHPSAFVDLVITPTMGTAWMMAEEALDKYLIKRMENHVENRVVRLLVRSFLNPSRSFANALRGKYPWNRDGRRL